MIDKHIVTEEDDEVVFQGSALHEYLSLVGYTDFEAITIPEKQVDQNESTPLGDDITQESIFRKMWLAYFWITQQNSDISKKQLNTILNAEVLLDDHASIIYTYIQKYLNVSWKKLIQKVIVGGSLLASSIYVSFKKYNNISIIVPLFLLCFSGYNKYLELKVSRDLKHLIMLQNNVYNLCKKGLKILRHGFKLKVSPGKSSQGFHDLMGEKLMYLQPITENLVNCMEDMSQIYYHTISIIISLLPPQFCNKSLTTSFEDKAFKIHGEINYEAVKQLYHIYVLTQSEMLHLLAIAYDSDTWFQTSNQIPQTKLAYIIRILATKLTKCKHKLSQYIDSYDNCKVEPVRYNSKKLEESKWQNLYMHLDLTSHKLQLAYHQIASILNDIDNCTCNISSDTDIAELFMEKMNEAYKQIEAARNFAEFSSLLITKTKHDNIKNSIVKQDIDIVDIPEVSVIIDSEPEIMDEVFEEYIKEEYLKCLCEEEDNSFIQSNKLDKLLAKNFMSELKEALIDKHKSMSERESRALQRMYKSIKKDLNDSKSKESFIPPPPPMTMNITTDSSKNLSHHVKYEIQDKTKKIFTDNIEIKNSTTPVTPSSETDLQEPILHFTLNLPSPVSRVVEETFIGSGENSEDEFVTNILEED